MLKPSHFGGFSPRKKIGQEKLCAETKFEELELKNKKKGVFVLDLQLPTVGFLLRILGEFLHSNPEFPPMLGDSSSFKGLDLKRVTSVVLIQPK